MNISNLEPLASENQIHWTYDEVDAASIYHYKVEPLCLLHNRISIDNSVKIWFQNRRMKWRNSKERELLASGGSREQTLPNKNNPHPDLSDAEADKQKMSPLSPANEEEDLKKMYATATNCQNDSYRYEDKIAGSSIFAREGYTNMEEGEDYESDASASDEEINVT